MRHPAFQRRAAAAAQCALLAACAAPATPPPEPPLPGPDLPVAYDCGDQPVTVRFRGDGVRLTIGDRTRTLTLAPAASGARYVGAGGATVFWDRGETAMVTAGGERLPTCEHRPGSHYTATGTEPGWRLRVGPVRLRLEADYGQRIVMTDTPRPQAEPDGTWVYRAEADGRALTVTIRPSYCENAMSGKPFPHTVTVDLEEQRLDGCGGDPAALIIGPVWGLESLNGDPVPPDGAPTLGFTGDGTVAGFDGCNRLRGRYRITGIGLAIDGLATTRKACPGPDASTRAKRFQALLGGVERFRLDRRGRLIVEGGGQAAALTARPD